MDTKYGMANYRWPGENNVNQHLYINLIDWRTICVREQGSYFGKNDNAKFAVMYEDRTHVHLRVVSGQDFDTATDLDTRQMDQYLSGYAP